MKKLRLELDDLAVESFGTHRDDDARGTVAGQNVPPYTQSCGGTCVNTCDSCVNTCLNTCQNTCWDTCQASCMGTCYLHCTDVRIC